MPQPGDPLPLSHKLFDTNGSVFVRATLKDSLGVFLPGSPFTLTHIGLGRYESLSVPMPAGVNSVSVTYEVFNSSGFEPESKSTVYGDGTDVFAYEIPAAFILDRLNQIYDLLLTGSGGSRSQLITGAIHQVQDLIGVVSRNDPKEVILRQNQSIDGNVSTSQKLEGLLDTTE